MATLTGSISLSASINLGDVSISFNGPAIGGHAIGEAPISSEVSTTQVTTSGLYGRLAKSIAAAPSASATLASDSEIRKYKLGATSIQGPATLSTIGRMGLRGQSHGHQGLGISATLTASIRGPIHGEAHLQARVGLFEAIRAFVDLQASATLVSDVQVTIFEVGSVDLDVTATLSGEGAVQSVMRVHLSPFANLSASSIVKLDLPYGTLYPSGLGLFVQGGIDNQTTLFMQGPIPNSFDSAMPEEGGSQDHRPAPILFIDGKGAIIDDDGTELFLQNIAPVEGSPNTSMNLHMAGRNFTPAYNSATLFIENGFKFIETGFIGRLPEVPLFIKADSSTTMDPVTMNLFIGPSKAPVWDMPLFIQTAGPVSGVPTLYINGLNYTNPDIDLYLRGPFDETTKNTNLHIQGY